MVTFKWTQALKKSAQQLILADANNYEVKRHKRLKGIKYLTDGRARWEGKAHDYTVDMNLHVYKK